MATGTHHHPHPQMVNHGDEAAAGIILAYLIRTKFHVIEEANSRLQDVPPELPPDLGGEIARFYWTILTGELRQEDNSLLAILLEQLIALGTGQPFAFLSTTRQYTNRLLQEAIHMTAASPGSNWLNGELLATLLGLVMPAEPVPQLEDASNPQDSDLICLSVGDKTLNITPQQVLDCFWKNELDTDCVVCKKPFENITGPPIRTFSKSTEREGEAGSANNNIRCFIRVVNRHFECLKNQGVRFVPVSHVWHRSVSEAHHSNRKSKEAETNQLKRTIKEAGIAVFKTIVQLYRSSGIAYEDDTEFWHDYLSVPQWVSDVQQSILFILPSIYHSAMEILVCMEDVSGRHISQILGLQPTLGQGVSLLDCLDAIPALHAFFHCRWLERMWVSVEYACSQKVSLMDGDDRIWRTWPQTDTAPTDFLSQFSEHAQGLLNEVFTQASSFSRSVFVGMPYFSRQVEDPCLGEVVSMIGGKDCFYHRDRFIAVHAILNQSASAAHIHRQPSLPQNATASCRQVWLHALERGDYSPLLLRPVVEETQTAQAQWLVGHERLCRQSWGLGDKVSDPTERDIVNESSIRPRMEIVGDIKNISVVDFVNQDPAAIVESILSSFFSTCTGGIMNFVSAITRLFPVDNNHKRRATMLHRIPPISYSEYDSADPTFATRLQAAIDEHSGSEIISILKLDHELIGMRSDITRLTLARSSSEEFHAVTNLNQHICTVQCNGCKKRHLFRLELRENAQVGARVYRIRGLSYSRTVENGVGLVIQNQQVVGRMIYGAPACNCHLTEEVLLV